MVIKELKEAIKDLSDDTPVHINLSGVETILDEDFCEVGCEIKSNISAINYTNDLTIEVQIDSHFNKKIYLCDLESTNQNALERVEGYEKETEENQEKIEELEEEIESLERSVDRLDDSNNALMDKVTQLRTNMKKLREVNFKLKEKKEGGNG